MKRNFKYITANKPLRAFTLVELLVVISIIALLLSILMPALQKARESARQLVCTANIRQQGIAMSAYATDNSDKYPFATAPIFWPFGGLLNWVVADYPGGPPLYDLDTFVPANQMALFVGNYITEPDVFYCPSARVGNDGYINRKDHWDHVAEAYSTPQHFGYRCSATYAGYTTWAGYGYDASGQFYPYYWPDVEQMKNFQRRAAKDVFSRGDTVTLSDIILERIGLDAPMWNNHSSNSKPTGGNVQFNDGSAKWVPFSKTELMLEHSTRTFNFRF